MIADVRVADGFRFLHGAGKGVLQLPLLMQQHVQQAQPPGVLLRPLTGERTLPDVPEENYWFRRHLVVYEWIAERGAGLDVVDMACGEGYGSRCWRGAPGG